MHLWDFALTVYQSDAVKQNCLSLQDDYGVDVCVILGICWLHNRGRTITEDDCLALEAWLDEWQRTKTQAVRALRRRVKRLGADNENHALAIGFYRAMLDLELQSERIALHQIEQFAVDHWALNLSAPTVCTQENGEELGQALSAYRLMREVPQDKFDDLYRCLLAVSSPSMPHF